MFSNLCFFFFKLKHLLRQWRAFTSGCPITLRTVMNFLICAHSWKPACARVVNGERVMRVLCSLLPVILLLVSLTDSSWYYVKSKGGRYLIQTEGIRLPFKDRTIKEFKGMLHEIDMTWNLTDLRIFLYQIYWNITDFVKRFAYICCKGELWYLGVCMRLGNIPKKQYSHIL